MVLKVSLEANLKVIDDIPKFKTAFRKEVIEKSLDAPLMQAAADLKVELKKLVNTQIENSGTVTDKVNPIQPTAPNPDNPLLSKSENDILKFLTGADTQKHSPKENHNVPDGSNILTAQYSKNTDGPFRIDVRLNIAPFENVETHYKRAMNIFNSSVFAIPNESGGKDFFVNLGENLQDVTKIDCSTMTGFGDVEPKKGMSPSRRFELDKKNKGYATWTLKQDFVKRIRRNQTQFANLTPVIKSIQEGKSEEALQYLKGYKQNPKMANITHKVEAIVKKKDLPVTLENYVAVVNFINAITVSKSVKAEVVTYSLISSSPGPTGEESVKFFDAVKNAMTLWLTSGADKWFKAMVDATERLIKKFEEGQ